MEFERNADVQEIVEAIKAPQNAEDLMVSASEEQTATPEVQPNVDEGQPNQPTDTQRAALKELGIDVNSIPDEVLVKIVEERKVDLTKSPSWRKAQAALQRQAEEARREALRLKTELEQLRLEQERLRRENRLKEVRTPQEREKILMEELERAEKVAEETRLAQIREEALKANAENIRRWNEYYVQNGLDEQTIDELSAIATQTILAAQGVDFSNPNSPEVQAALSNITPRQWHEVRHQLVQRELARRAQNQTQTTPQQTPAPQQAAQPQQPKRNAPVTVQPQEGVVGEPSFIDLWNAGKVEEAWKLLE